MKKKILTTLSVVLILGLAALGILAYLMDDDSDVNVMTLGNVSIDQIEQERDTNGNLVDFSSKIDSNVKKPLFPAVFEGTSIPWAPEEKWVKPGDQAWKVVEDNANVVDKFVTVKNTGKSPAYVRTLVAYEGDATYGPNGAYIHVVTNGKNVNPQIPNNFVGYINIEGVDYTVYEYVYPEALEAGKTSIPSLKQVYMNKAADNDVVAHYGDTYDILVLSQAAQTAGFDTAEEALNTAFGNVTSEKATEWFEKVLNPADYYVGTVEELKAALAEGGTVMLKNDIKTSETLEIPAGVEVVLDMNGKSITMPGGLDVKNVPAMIKVKMADVAGGDVAKLTITGNGTFDVGNNGAAAVFPGGDVVIENGTFVRDLTGIDIDLDVVYPLISGYNGNKYPGQLGKKLVINGGYFDGGYYDNNADKLFNDFVETHVEGQGQHNDSNVIRNAVKNNITGLINVSNGYIYDVNGGTFVGANPAWGDEGCMLPSNYNGNYLRPWSYYQGGFIPGQEFNENDIKLPAGYSVTEGKTDKGIPTYTVNYSK